MAYKGFIVPKGAMMKLLAAKQVAEVLGVHKNRVFIYAREREDFPKPVRLSVRCVRWKADEIEAWVDAQRAVAA